MSWTVAEVLDRLRELDESARVEAKRGLGKSAIDTVSAFSNEPELGGGWLLFGVERDDAGAFHLVGVDDPDQLQADLSTRCRTELNRPVRPEIRVAAIEGKRLVCAYIPEADPADKPIYKAATGLPKGGYRRVGSTDQRLTDDDLALLASRAQRVPYDRRPLPGAELEDLDPDAIAAYRRQLRESRPTSELHDHSDHDLLRAIGALTDHGGKRVPTIAGIVLFGRKLALRRLLPALRVDYVRVRGTRWTGDQGDLYDSLEIREPLVLGWRRAYAAVLDDLPVGFDLPADDPRRRNVPRLPERVVREAIVNALAHRDYETHAAVQIRRFADRVEIENPGASLVPEEQWGEPVSRPRNPSIIDVFRELDLAEAKGTGLRRMRERMAEAGLSMPILESHREPGRFVVTLLFHHFLDDVDVDWLGRIGELDDVDAQVLLYARNTGRISNREVRAFSRDDTLAASARLRRLRDRGLIEQRGEARQHTFYVLSPTWTGAVASEHEAPRDLRTALLDELPDDLRRRVEALPARAGFEELASLLVDLGRLRFWEPGELARLLDRHADYLRSRYLVPLTDQGRLTLRFPGRRHHPQQAYGVDQGGSG